jgi:hypothetical protein
MPDTQHEDRDNRDEHFGVEDAGPHSQTSRGTTPIQHGSIGPTADHEQAQDLIMGEGQTASGGAATAGGERTATSREG